MTSYCGYIAIVGRPNVGKSTLLNKILRQKISITSRKAQTTRHRILGIDTRDTHQLIYVDTPGLHGAMRSSMNKMMNRTASSVLAEVDVILFVTDGTHWQEDDELVLNMISKTKAPCLLVINKIDKIADKSLLLPWLQSMQSRHDFIDMIPVSAKTAAQIDLLESKLKALMPEGPHLYDASQITDRSDRFLCQELLREKIFRACGQELPYSTAVVVESFKEDEDIVHIHALIMVEKESHKRMIIGSKGHKLKEMASLARLDMERLLQKKVYLKSWCKLKPGWSNDELMFL